MNNYQPKKVNRTYKPSYTLADFAELRNLNANVLCGLLQHDKAVKVALKRRNTNLYHLCDLDAFVAKNKEKLSCSQI